MKKEYTKIVKKFKNKKWKKRGKWFHTIAFSEIFIEGESTSSSRKLGLPFKRHRCVWFSDGDFYDLAEDWEGIKKNLENGYKKDKNYLNKYASKCLIQGSKIIKYIDKVRDSNYEEYSDTRLLKSYKELVTRCKYFMPYMFSLHIFDQFLTEKFESLLKLYINKEELPDDISFELQQILAYPFKKYLF